MSSLTHNSVCRQRIENDKGTRCAQYGSSPKAGAACGVNDEHRQVQDAARLSALVSDVKLAPGQVQKAAQPPWRLGGVVIIRKQVQEAAQPLAGRYLRVP